MSENNFGHPAIPKFDGHFDHWAMLMENLLRSKEYWSIVEGGIPVLPTAATSEQRKIVEEARLKDLKAKNYLFQSIDRSIIETILDKSSSKAIWDSMARKYQGSTKVKRAQLQALRGEFEMLRMKEEDTVNDYFAKVLATVNKMKIQGESIEERIVVEKILRSMGTKFNYVVCAIEESNNTETLSIDELQGSLLVHELKIKPVKERASLESLLW
jgi:type I site-specific restriction endonuclease